MVRLVGRRCKAVIGCAAIALVLVGCGGKDDSKTTSSNGNTSNTTTKSSKRAVQDAAVEERNYSPLALDQDFAVCPVGKSLADAGWSSSGDVITCSGSTKGYVFTKEIYDNFTLRFDVQFKPADNAADEAKLNTGALVYITGDPKVWPKCLEVQGKYTELGMIKSNGGVADPEVTDHGDARTSARKPPVEWNSIEIVSNGGALTVKINGRWLPRVRPASSSRGRLGFNRKASKFTSAKFALWFMIPMRHNRS